MEIKPTKSTHVGVWKFSVTQSLETVLDPYTPCANDKDLCPCFGNVKYAIKPEYSTPVKSPGKI
jgi:hypothetical protein